jgi:hypothetical protein
MSPRAGSSARRLLHPRRTGRQVPSNSPGWASPGSAEPARRTAASDPVSACPRYPSGDRRITLPVRQEACTASQSPRQPDSRSRARIGRRMTAPAQIAGSSRRGSTPTGPSLLPRSERATGRQAKQPWGRRDRLGQVQRQQPAQRTRDSEGAASCFVLLGERRSWYASFAARP